MVYLPTKLWCKVSNNDQPGEETHFDIIFIAPDNDKRSDHIGSVNLASQSEGTDNAPIFYPVAGHEKQSHARLSQEPHPPHT